MISLNQAVRKPCKTHGLDICLMRFPFWASTRVLEYNADFEKSHIFYRFLAVFSLYGPKTSKNPLRHNFDGEITNNFCNGLVM